VIRLGEAFVCDFCGNVCVGCTHREFKLIVKMPGTDRMSNVMVNIYPMSCQTGLSEALCDDCLKTVVIPKLLDEIPNCSSQLSVRHKDVIERR